MSANQPLISLSGVSKCFHIYDNPRHRLMQMLVRNRKKYYREFWALRDINFDIYPGETVGIIGRNGAGKSTLLQILCGTLTPSSGSVKARGRVAALLELGAGFNAEFTGRENVYMNAGILGLSKAEIDARFDDIVKFADIGDHLDQPVKTYSSGMYVRLAFAVIVHVDADILIVDEALAVGDMYFQSKCMAHMKQLIETGVTVLFVSHDVGAVKALCQKAIYLDRGCVVAAGSTEEVVEAYYGAGVRGNQKLIASVDNESHLQVDIAELGQDQLTSFSQRAAFQRLQNGMADLILVQLLDQKGLVKDVFEFGEEIILRMIFRANVQIPSVALAYHLRDKNGFDVIYSDTVIEKTPIVNISAGEKVVIDWKFKSLLRDGEYSISAMLSVPQDLSIGKAEVCDFVPLAANLRVIRGNHLPIYGVAYWPNVLTVHRGAQTQ